ncbi:unnamed protein product [Diamesa tonsa]
MDQNKHQTSNKSNKTTEKRINSNDSEVQQDVVQSHVRPYLPGNDIAHQNLGEQFNVWKKNLTAEVGESPLKLSINKAEGKRRVSNNKIEMADELLQQVSDAEKQFDLSFDEFFKNIETSSEDMDGLSVSLDSFIESSTEIQEVFQNVKDFVEKQ